MGKFGYIYYDSEVFKIFKTTFDVFNSDMFLIILTPNEQTDVMKKLEAVSFPLNKVYVSKVPHSEVAAYLSSADFAGTVSIGSDEMISINNLAQMIIDISGKNITVKNIAGPTGVRGRNSDNTPTQKELKWTPSVSLREGIEKTYNWIESQVKEQDLCAE
jgi:hypothetical protein